MHQNDPVMAAWERRNQLRIGAEAMPDPSEEEIAYAAHILSEWLDDAAPMNERRYRDPGKAVLKFAAYMQLQRPAHIDALEARAAPRVKMLVWSEEVGNVTGTPVWRAPSMLGRYTIVGDLWWGPEPTNDWANAADVDACKAAANADYAARIISALEPS